jgi:hypothetical protein
MLLESFLVLGVLGIILIFFYRQAVEEFRILQTESLEKAMPLLHERCPIVVLPAPELQNLWTRQDIQQRPTLGTTAFNGTALKDAVTKESFPLTPKSAEALATAIGLPVWVNQTLLPTYKDANWWGPVCWTRTEALIGAQGLRQTFAYSTLLFATEGALAVSIIHGGSDNYLPKVWRGKRLSKMTRDDAPLLHQIQYMDVIVRPGSALLIPPHWKVCWENYEQPQPALAMWVEIHHPLSHFVRQASQRRFA